MRPWLMHPPLRQARPAPAQTAGPVRLSGPAEEVGRPDSPHIGRAMLPRALAQSGSTLDGST